MSDRNTTRNSSDGPTLLPPQIARSEDLSWNAQQLDPAMESPYSDPAFQVVFLNLARALHRRQFPHAFLVGERGVGKSTLVAEFARRVLCGEFKFLMGKRFLAVDTRFIPNDEARQRLAAIFGIIANQPNLVVVWDGLPALLLGAPQNSFKSILMAGVAAARCQLIVLATRRELEEFMNDDLDLQECFSIVEVEEPDIKAVTPVLTHFAKGLSEKYQLTIESEAITAALTLSTNYILNDQLPVKALKILVRACEQVDFQRMDNPSTPSQVSVNDVIEVISELTGVPGSTLAGMADRTDYDAALREVIYGQDHAVAEVATELGLIKAGMSDPGKPASVMLFLGQTGTGKTELAKALARFYSASKKLKTYTLGNCVEAHSVSTIIGVPPGYVGSERGGRITADLNADPYSVFLLDEADKAHPDVLQPFLNLFDEGWVTDQRGSKGFATKAIFIMTTNVGQRMIADMVRDGKSNDEIATRMKEALSQIRHTKSDRPVFTPEFLARIKRIIVFRPLNQQAMIGIAKKLFRHLQNEWQDRRGKQLELPEPLAVYIGEAAYRKDHKSGGKEGGRVVRKLVAEWLEAPLQRAMAADPESYRSCMSAVVQEELPTEIPADEIPLPVPVVRIVFR